MANPHPFATVNHIPLALGILYVSLVQGDLVLIAEDGLTESRAAAPRIELPSLIAATMRSRKSPDSGAGMTSPPTHQNRLPRISIPDSAQHKSALALSVPNHAINDISLAPPSSGVFSFAP